MFALLEFGQKPEKFDHKVSIVLKNCRMLNFLFLGKQTVNPVIAKTAGYCGMCRTELFWKLHDILIWILFTTVLPLLIMIILYVNLVRAYKAQVSVRQPFIVSICDTITYLAINLFIQ